MSRGLGKIERGILAAFKAESDNAFTVDDLCRWVYPAANRPERKHRVAILRAAKKLVDRAAVDHNPCNSYLVSELLGGALVFFDAWNVTSYAMARLKADDLNGYRSNDDRRSWRPRHEDELRAMIEPGGKFHDYVIAGGAWWGHAREAMAKRDGDMVTYNALREARADALRRMGFPGAANSLAPRGSSPG